MLRTPDLPLWGEHFLRAGFSHRTALRKVRQACKADVDPSPPAISNRYSAGSCIDSILAGIRDNRLSCVWRVAIEGGNRPSRHD